MRACPLDGVLGQWPVDQDGVVAELTRAADLEPRARTRACETMAARLRHAGVEPAFPILSAASDDPLGECADLYWRGRFTDLPSLSTAVTCAQWLARWVPDVQVRRALEPRWASAFAEATDHDIEPPDEATASWQRSADPPLVDAACFALLYQAGKLARNFRWSDLAWLLEGSPLATATGDRAGEPIVVALRAAAALGRPREINRDHALRLVQQAWATPDRSPEVVAVCLSALEVAAEGELLRHLAAEAVAAAPADHRARAWLAEGEWMSGYPDAALAALGDALRLLPQDAETRDTFERYNERRRAIRRLAG